jgi:hypothetical protein
MRLSRLKTQWLMVGVIIAGILSWGVPSLISETRRRWNNYQSRSAYHTKQAKMYAVWAKGSTEPSPEGSCVKCLYDFHAAKSEEYSRAVYQPWVVYSRKRSRVVGDKRTDTHRAAEILLRCFGRSHRSAQRRPWLLRSITPTRANAPSGRGLYRV